MNELYFNFKIISQNKVWLYFDPTLSKLNVIKYEKKMKYHIIRTVKKSNSVTSQISRIYGEFY